MGNRTTLTEEQREKHRTASRKWSATYPDRKKASVEKWKLKNPGKLLELQRNWRDKNREEVNRKSREYKRKQRAENPELYNTYLRHYRFRSKYGMTIKDYEDMYRLQNGCCAVCGDSSPNSGKGGINVDHDHATGQVRELLCGHCNRAIGNLKEDVCRAEALIKYLKKHKER